MAIPFTVQIRTLVFNSTTFDNCKESKNIHYPPVSKIVLYYN